MARHSNAAAVTTGVCNAAPLGRNYGVRISRDRLLADLHDLAAFGATADGGVERTSFSPDDLAARQWLSQRCDDAGMTLRRDGIGNLFARLGDQPGPAVWTGSHLDSVPNGGRFDGALGVLSSLEALRTIAEDATPPPRALQLVVFADEEGCYHHLLGSSALVQGFDADTLAGLVGRDGRRLTDALRSAGIDPAEATATTVDPADVHAFIELHIEQGVTLERASAQIGVVESIVGLGGGCLTFLGRADHAGTTPMDLRRDPMRSAACFLSHLQQIVADAGDGRAVATCGRLAVAPGADNIVAERVTVFLDFRDPDRKVLAALEHAIVQRAKACAAEHDVEVTYERDSLIDPVPLDDGVRAAIAEVADEQGRVLRHLPSGAGHDSQQMARIAPTGMIFVPSRDGRSHSPAEHTDADDVEAGANVLLHTLLRLADA
ncbi:MAG: Zn-dependent hydrolase [Actinomycetota bacterium]|nr:Zn-dependent hydrolase [Actinomycetota bacterium]